MATRHVSAAELHPDAQPAAAGARSRQKWILALMAVASFMVALDTLVVSTALTTIRLDLGASIEQLEWTVNAFNLTLAILLLPAAALGDRFGRRRMFAAGLGLFIAASAACALSPSVEALIAARAVQGAGAALVTSLALAIVGAAYPADSRGGAVGILEGIAGLALIAGPVLGGAIVGGLDWEWIFWLNVPIGLVIIPLVLIRINESPREDAALDLPGLALITGGVLGVVWGLVRVASSGWGSLEVLAALAFGLLLIAAFVIWEKQAPAPMLAIGLFSSRGFTAGNAATFALFASIFIGVFFIAQFLQTVLGYSPLGAGLRLLPWTGALFIIAPLAGALADRIGERPLLVGGLTLHAAGYAWLGLIAAPDLAYSEMVLPLIVIAIGGSMALPPAATAVLRSVSASAIGKAAGANGMFRELGGVFGLAIAVTVFAAGGSYASAAAFSDGFAAAMAAPVGLSLAGVVAACAVPGRLSDVEAGPD